MKSEQQAILARDMIEMIHEYQDDADILEYLDGMAFAIARGIEDTTVIDWDRLASIIDQRYYSLQQEQPVPLDTGLLKEISSKLKAHLSQE